MKNEHQVLSQSPSKYLATSLVTVKLKDKNVTSKHWDYKVDGTTGISFYWTQDRGE